MDLQLIHVSLLNEHERFNKTKCNFAGGQWPDLTLTSEPEISELVLHFMAFLSEIFKNQKGRLKQRHDRHLAGKSTRDDSLARNTLVSTLMSIIGKFGFEIYLIGTTFPNLIKKKLNSTENWQPNLILGWPSSLIGLHWSNNVKSMREQPSGGFIPESGNHLEHTWFAWIQLTGQEMSRFGHTLLGSRVLRGLNQSKQTPRLKRISTALVGAFIRVLIV